MVTVAAAVTLVLSACATSAGTAQSQAPDPAGSSIAGEGEAAAADGGSGTEDDRTEATANGSGGTVAAGSATAGENEPDGGDQPEGAGSTGGSTDDGEGATGADPLCAELDPTLTPIVGATASQPDPGGDLDGDGIDEQLLVSDGGPGQPLLVQVIRSSDGEATVPLELDGIALLVTWLDAADADGDGRDEVFLSLGGNTALNGIVVELDGCDLRPVVPAQGDVGIGFPGEPFQYTYFASGNSCAPLGCFVSLSCRTGDTGPELVLSSVRSTVGLLDPGFDLEAWEALDPALRPVSFEVVTLRLTDGQVERLSVVRDETVLGRVEAWTELPEVGCSAGLAGQLPDVVLAGS